MTEKNKPKKLKYNELILAKCKVELALLFRYVGICSVPEQGPKRKLHQLAYCYVVTFNWMDSFMVLLNDKNEPNFLFWLCIRLAGYDRISSFHPLWGIFSKKESAVNSAIQTGKRSIGVGCRVYCTLLFGFSSEWFTLFSKSGDKFNNPITDVYPFMVFLMNGFWKEISKYCIKNCALEMSVIC